MSSGQRSPAKSPGRRLKCFSFRTLTLLPSPPIRLVTLFHILHTFFPLDPSSAHYIGNPLDFPNQTKLICRCTSKACVQFKRVPVHSSSSRQVTLSVSICLHQRRDIVTQKLPSHCPCATISGTVSSAGRLIPFACTSKMCIRPSLFMLLFTVQCKRMASAGGTTLESLTPKRSHN